MSGFKHFEAHPLHPTFAAELRGIDWPNINSEVIDEIRAAVDKASRFQFLSYGVCVLRNTGLDDDGHVEFSKSFGDLDNIKRFIHKGRKMRYSHYELFDASNLDENNELLDPNSARAHANRGNGIFHSDSSYNPRRASYSLLRATTLPPPGTGGATEFGDSRSAFDDLPEPLKSTLLSKNYVGAHTFAQSRKLGSPEFFSDLVPSTFPMARHRVVQLHEQSGRMTLYVGAHLHHIEGLDEKESEELREYLKNWVAQDKYRVSVEWEQPGDIVIWDNRSTVHRAKGGEFEGKYKRDLRRTTVHDDGEGAWGLNETAEGFPSFNMGEKKLGGVEPAAPRAVVA
ncbi:hypothetical protein jhhlp_002700 [Lomentospora prolificans]|uniref:TauD/TfdA-like domain-containing protein n=1 Tax=Lomentospora prolificans TaxID=41688 RepID=A0A2N3NF01_9PEZI|nr:hypothetical protein jhhlp_002700 [Lomentospora prolificans]